MAKYVLGGEEWTVNGHPLEIRVSQEQIDVTSDRDTTDPNWTFTDERGHDHYYDHGYPTLNYIIDKQHWCNGTEGIYNHDPHWAVDEAHYECKQCGETIKPGVIPAFTPQVVPGVRTIEATVYGDVGESFEYEYGGEIFEFERVSLAFDKGSSPVSEYVGRGRARA